MKVRYTVPSAVTRAAYVGNDVTTVFSAPFNFFDDSDLDVILVTDATGVEVTQVLTTNYTVSGGGGDNGSVTMLVAPPTGTTLVIERDIPYTQEIDLEPNDPFPAEVTEEGFDRATMLAQQNRLEIQKSPKLPATYDPDSDPEIRLPLPESGKLLAGKSDASGWENVTVASISTDDIPVLLSSVANMDRLIYKSSAGVWVNVPSTDYEGAIYAVSPGSADNSAALLAAITAANATGGWVVLPAGEFTFTSAVTMALTKKVGIRGAGPNATVLKWTNSSGGLSLEYATQTLAPHVKDLSLQTTYAGGGTALLITQNPALATAYSIGPVVTNVEARGTAPASAYWAKGISLVDTWYPQLSQFTVKGKDEVVLPFSMTCGVEYVRAMGLVLRDFTMQHMTAGVLQGGTTFGEGLNASSFEIVGVSKGFDLTSVASGSIPIQGIQNGHINAYTYGLHLKNTVQGNFSGLLIYKTHLSTSAWNGIFAEAGVDNCNIDTQILGAGTGVSSGGMTGVVLTDSNFNKISCRFDQWEGAGSGVVLGTGSKENIVTNNVGGNQGSAINVAVINSDAGANNVIESNLATGSGAAVSSNSTTAPQKIRDNHPLVAQLLTQNDTTPSVISAQHEIWRTNNSSSTTITAFDDGVLGQTVHLQLNDANTGFTHNASSFILNGGANIAVGTGAGHTLSFVFIGTAWVEIARSF